ncbi:hypothetical protein GCM10027456_20750 [Kineosporia babensis]
MATVRGLLVAGLLAAAAKFVPQAYLPDDIWQASTYLLIFVLVVMGLVLIVRRRNSVPTKTAPPSTDNSGETPAELPATLRPYEPAGPSTEGGASTRNVLDLHVHIHVDTRGPDDEP